MSCQPHVAKQIIGQGGDCLLSLQANQPTLLAEAGAQLTDLAYVRWAYPSDGSTLSYRKWTQANLCWVDEDGRWPGLHTLVRLETRRQDDQKQPVGQQRYYSSGRALAPTHADAAVRGHWAIEKCPALAT